MRHGASGHLTALHPHGAAPAGVEGLVVIFPDQAWTRLAYRQTVLAACGPKMEGRFGDIGAVEAEIRET